jgi:hypothetical protein
MAQEQYGKPQALSKKEAREILDSNAKLLKAARAPKDELRRFVIMLAGMFKAAGVDEFECEFILSLPTGCCQSWNRLIAALGTAAEFDAANEVLAVCSGIG